MGHPRAKVACQCQEEAHYKQPREETNNSSRYMCNLIHSVIVHETMIGIKIMRYAGALHYVSCCPVSSRKGSETGRSSSVCLTPSWKIRIPCRVMRIWRPKFVTTTALLNSTRFTGLMGLSHRKRKSCKSCQSCRRRCNDICTDRKGLYNESIHVRIE